MEKEEYETIRDLSKTGFETTTDKGLVQGRGHSQPHQEKNKIEMTRRLKKSIDVFNEKSSNQTKWIIYLTIAMLLVGVAQIGLLVYSLFTQS